MKFATKLAKCFFFNTILILQNMKSCLKNLLNILNAFGILLEKFQKNMNIFQHLLQNLTMFKTINLEIIHQLNELPNSEKGTILDENATIKLQIIEKIKNKTSDKKIEPSIAKEFIQVIMSASSGPQNYERFKSILESLDDENSMPNIADIAESLFSGFSPMQYEFEEVYKDINDFGNELKSVLEETLPPLSQKNEKDNEKLTKVASEKSSQLPNLKKAKTRKKQNQNINYSKWSNAKIRKKQLENDTLINKAKTDFGRAMALVNAEKDEKQIHMPPPVANPTKPIALVKNQQRTKPLSNILKPVKSKKVINRPLQSTK